MLGEFNSRILMEIQYNFPITETPFTDLAERLNIEEEEFLKKLRILKLKGVIKRIGANINYRAFKKIRRACLIAFACDEDDVLKIAKAINDSFSDLSLKHNYWRDHEKYKIWFTVKAKSIQEISKKVEEIAEKFKIREYLILPSKRVYRMDVKYDLFRGISWSNRLIEKDRVSSVDDLGLDQDLLISLQDIPIKKRPFKDFGNEAEIVDLIRELIRKGIFRDFYAVLNEIKIGFKENGMNLVQTDDPKTLALKLIKFPQITHLVERHAPDDWKYPLYFMIHATDRSKIEEVVNTISEELEIKIKTIYSKMDLKKYRSPS